MTDPGGWDSDNTPDESDSDNLSYGTDESPPTIHDLACGGRLRDLREALEAGRDVDETNNHGWEPHHWQSGKKNILGCKTQMHRRVGCKGSVTYLDDL